MAFMQREIISGYWYRIDGEHGVVYIPVDTSEPGKVDHEKMCQRANESEDFNGFKPLYDGEITEVRYQFGFGCRLQAPGYLDATDWEVFSNEDACKSYLDELEGDTDGLEY